MDNGRSEISKHWQNAIIIYANRREFKPGENFDYPQVQSCFLAHCTAGTGEITVNGRTFTLTTGSMLFAPWNHHIIYHPDIENPFALECVHMIPDIAETDDVKFNAFHSANTAHPIYHKRSNDIVDKFNLSSLHRCSPENPLLKLIGYTIDTFKQQATEEQLRLTARLLFFELYNILHAAKEEHFEKYPPAIQNMLAHIEDYMTMPLPLSQLVIHGNVSMPSVFRLFRKYLNTTPQRYITKRRLQYAAKMLRESTIQLNVLAMNLQFSNTGNFSRAFKAEFGMSPGRYRKSPFLSPIDGRLKRPPKQSDTFFNPNFIPKTKK